LSTYRSKCRLVQILTTVVILVLPFLNLLRLDIPTLRFYFLNTVLWVDEFFLVFLVLMLVLWGIVFFSMLYGRVWCGWMCPQMIMSILVRWFESVSGRLLKYRPKKAGPIKRVSFHLLVSIQVALLSLVVGFNLVSYFVDPYRILSGLRDGSLEPLVGQFIIGIAIFMWVNILFWRETFCIKACPYGMMQLLLTDSKTQIMRYHTDRADDCIECQACVKCCLMGIDIRTSPYQTECVYCGDCVDACNAILPRQKTHKPGLISFSWGERDKRDTWYEKLGFVDVKRWVILGLMVVYTAGLVAVVSARQPLSLSATNDRSTLYRQESDGSIHNDYAIRLSNRSLDDGRFRLVCAQPGGGSGDLVIDCGDNPFEVKSREALNFKMTISTSGERLHPGPNKLMLSLENVDEEGMRIEKEIVFFMPEEFDLKGLAEPAGIRPSGENR